MGAVTLEAIENNLVKSLLDYYSPVAMYSIRVGLVTLILFLLIRPQISKVTTKEIKHLTLVGFLWVVIMIFVYYGYQTVGIVYTTLILMLAPVLIVMGSFIFLKEKKIRTYRFGRFVRIRESDLLDFAKISPSIDEIKRAKQLINE